VTRKHDNDYILRDAVNYQRAGGKFITAEQSLDYLRSIIKTGVKMDDKNKC